MRRWLTPSVLAPSAIIVAVSAMVVWANIREGRDVRPSTDYRASGMKALGTSRDALDRRIAEMQARIDAKADDVGAAVQLADALIRQSRVTAGGSAVLRADAVLRAALREAPEHYDLLHMQGLVSLSQHKFNDAIAMANRLIALRPRDAANYGMLGDAHLELGDYDEAFTAFDRMMQLRPGAAAYARVSYARELQGSLKGALEAMQMAADATGGGDLEGISWTRSQVGELYLRLDQPVTAMREFATASQAFPGHPFAVAGYARALMAQGKLTDALALFNGLLSTAPTPDLHVQVGDLLNQLARTDEARRHYALAEAAWRSDAPEPKHLARFLADRGERIDEAVRIAEEAAAARRDIFTQDALAWAYFKAGRLADAKQMSARARRTGSRDRDLLRHAAAIDQAVRASNVSTTSNPTATGASRTLR